MASKPISPFNRQFVKINYRIVNGKKMYVVMVRYTICGMRDTGCALSDWQLKPSLTEVDCSRRYRA